MYPSLNHFAVLIIGIFVFEGRSIAAPPVSIAEIESSGATDHIIMNKVAHGNGGYTRYPDGTVSFDQPKGGDIVNGKAGTCGPVAVANLLALHGFGLTSPDDIMHTMPTRKLDVGSTPSELTQSLEMWIIHAKENGLESDQEFNRRKTYVKNHVFKQTNSGDESAYFSDLYRAVNRVPNLLLGENDKPSATAALVTVANGGAHWVTVLKIESVPPLSDVELKDLPKLNKLISHRPCKVTNYQFGKKYEIDCADFVRMASLTKLNTSSDVARRIFVSGQIKPFTLIKAVRDENTEFLRIERERVQLPARDDTNCEGNIFGFTSTPLTPLLTQAVSDLSWVAAQYDRGAIRLPELVVGSLEQDKNMQMEEELRNRILNRALFKDSILPTH